MDQDGTDGKVTLTTVDLNALISQAVAQGVSKALSDLGIDHDSDLTGRLGRMEAQLKTGNVNSELTKPIVSEEKEQVGDLEKGRSKNLLGRYEPVDDSPEARAAVLEAEKLLVVPPCTAEENVNVIHRST